MYIKLAAALVGRNIGTATRKFSFQLRLTDVPRRVAKSTEINPVLTLM